MKKIAVIGAGVFGVTAALELARTARVTIFEKESGIILGASISNHLRHHHGYHYPRSRKTALESRVARESFEKEYEKAVVRDFPAYYGIAKKGSHSSPAQFLEFCESLGMPYKESWPDESYMDRSKIALCVAVPEPVYDPDILRDLLLKKLSKSEAQLCLNSRVLGGRFSGAAKVLTVSSSSVVKDEEFDFIVNATYSRSNALNEWFGFTKQKNLYELVELLELKIPMNKTGLTIIDGTFSSLLPRGAKDTFTLGHVKASVLKESVSEDLGEVAVLQNLRSNQEEILARGREDFPIVKQAHVVRSIFVERMVKADSEKTDERPSEIRDLGKGIYSIFAGKVITCVEMARAVSMLIEENCGSKRA